MKERIFALDIGTRSVIGLLLEEQNGQYQLIDFYAMEHKERSMLDGQIHDVVAVADVINKVKEQLEKDHGPLEKVCVAAAGRSLRTKRVAITKQLDQQSLLDRESVIHFELSGVQQAQFEIAKEQQNSISTNYYCVGYSVLQYKLDNEEIGSLIDQQGLEASVEIIATFLPKVVVESLLAALQRAGLEMEALTLEPIAAINVLIPSSMRRLNIALVDIGAGTSDIAITNEGTITAYGMVPKAGDEITEAVSDHYLLDFNEAEKAKRTISTEGQAVITDILGFDQQINFEQFTDDISDAIHKLADAIAKEIILLNGEAPKAVMLVGGGSQTPLMAKLLADKLGLPENRVAIRGTEAISTLQKTDNLPDGPAYITPLGIAIAAKQNPIHYMTVQVNNKTIRLFDMKQLTIGDGLLASGIELNKLYGKPGAANIVQYNGKSVTIPGTMGTAPAVTLNGEPASLHSSISNNDQILVQKGADGTASQITLADFIGDLQSGFVYLNGEKYQLPPRIIVNQQSISNLQYELKDHDKIEVTRSISAEQFFYQNKLPLPSIGEAAKYALMINDQQVHLETFDQQFTINGAAAALQDTISAGDSIYFQERKIPAVTELLPHLVKENKNTMLVFFNEQPITLTQPAPAVYQDGSIIAESAALPSGSRITLRTKDQSFILQDIFRYVDIDSSSITGGFKLYKNNKEASFDDSLNPHDRITLTY